MSEPNGARRHRVVIIGSGFGGLFAAKHLKHEDVDVTLIAKTTHHTLRLSRIVLGTSFKIGILSEVIGVI